MYEIAEAAGPALEQGGDTKQGDRRGAGGVELRLADRWVGLGRDEYRAFVALSDWLPSNAPFEALERAAGLPAPRLDGLFAHLERAGLVYRKADVPASISGVAFHDQIFAKVLPSWLAQGFSHPFWDRMTSGRGSAALFTGWLIELYHYTKNANRHMPLSCAYALEKPIKQARARHYAEEWNHYHYFLKALRALGFESAAIADSVPLPMTLALSSFMRQAAREDVLAYSICSAVLEGTTTERRTYDSYYQRAMELYGIPMAAVQPIYDHLALDVQYEHGNLFREILAHVPELSAARAGRILDYGHQLAEHIWLWTDGIERYYGAAENPVPRPAFDLIAD